MGRARPLNLLLDTHVWLWGLLEPERLRAGTRAALEDAANRLYLSPVSVWEALLLLERGRIELRVEPRVWISRALEQVPMFEAPLTFGVALETAAVRLSHRDPADRLLAATARGLDLTLVTADQRLLSCTDVRTLEA